MGDAQMLHLLIIRLYRKLINLQSVETNMKASLLKYLLIKLILEKCNCTVMRLIGSCNIFSYCLPDLANMGPYPPQGLCWTRIWQLYWTNVFSYCQFEDSGVAASKVHWEIHFLWKGILQQLFFQYSIVRKLRMVCIVYSVQCCIVARHHRQ